MPRKFDLERTLNELCAEATRGGRSVNLSKIVGIVVDLSGRLPENVRKSVLPLMMQKYTRVAEEDFVADKSLEFDVSKIDEIIDETMGASDYLPMRAFEPFARFPFCSNNRSWNLYIFESYCLKKSEKFKRVALLFNKQCSGTVARVDCQKTFHEILVDATAKSALEELSPVAVTNYLKESGYIGKAKYDQIDQLLEDVKLARQKKT